MAEQQKKINPRILLFVISYILITVLFILGFATRITVKENRAYHTKNEVALYLFTFETLPENYHPKSFYSDSGIQPANGYYIGGDVFYYSGAVQKYTKNTNLIECDVDYPKDSTLRGVNRLVYTEDCSEIFFTNTHYGDTGSPAFQKVSKFGINSCSNICFILLCVIIAGDTVYIVLKQKQKDETITADVVKSFEDFVTVLMIPIVTVWGVSNLIIQKIKETKNHKIL